LHRRIDAIKKKYEQAEVRNAEPPEVYEARWANLPPLDPPTLAHGSGPEPTPVHTANGSNGVAPVPDKAFDHPYFDDDDTAGDLFVSGHGVEVR
jgi:hypothetical protein